MWLAVFKLGGESKFGTQTLEDIKDLRARLLRAIAVSLKGVFEPILTDASTVNVSSLVLPGNDEGGPSPGITKLGEEKLLNAVRDFVKSDVNRMKSLRSLDVAESHITRCLRMLRVWVIVSGIASGAFTLASLAITADMVMLTIDWPFVTAFALLAVCLASSAIFTLRVVLAVNTFDVLKDKHADLS